MKSIAKLTEVLTRALKILLEPKQNLKIEEILKEHGLLKASGTDSKLFSPPRLVPCISEALLTELETNGRASRLAQALGKIREHYLAENESTDFLFEPDLRGTPPPTRRR